MSQQFIPLSVPNFSGNEKQYVNEAVISEWVSTGGSKVSEFEEKIAEYTHMPRAVACNSGTSGLHLAMLMAGVGRGDEVLAPALTFIAAVNPIRYAGAEPVFIGCGESLCLCPALAGEWLAANTEQRDGKCVNRHTGAHVKALLAVHVFGNMANMPGLVELCRKYGLVLIEDSTEALGTYYTEGPYRGKMAGTIGDIGVYSFNGNKIITTGAGGLAIDTHKKACAPVVIMAGGLGTRLYPYTKILPKPLIPIGEMPIVEHIIHRFADVGCSAFTMIVNYKKSMIKSYFNDLQKDYTVDYVDEDTPLGTGGGLSLLKGKVTQTFFLTNCDILIDADFGDIYQYHKEKGNVITMVCAVKHFTIPYGVVELGGDGDISGITEKPEMNFLTNTGVYVVEPSVIDGLAYNEPIPFTDIIADVRAAGGRVGVYPVSENSWMDMGQLEELDNMRRRLEMQ